MIKGRQQWRRVINFDMIIKLNQNKTNASKNISNH